MVCWVGGVVWCVFFFWGGGGFIVVGWYGGDNGAEDGKQIDEKNCNMKVVEVDGIPWIYSPPRMPANEG